MRGAGNRADAPRKRERRPRERTGEKKYDFRLCAQLIFCSHQRANDALKHKLFSVEKNSHTDKKIRHAHAHVQNDASTHTYFYAHPYTRKRIKHTRDCNLIALNASHKYTCILFLIFFPLIFWSRGFVCLPKKNAITERHRTRKRHKRAKKRDRRGIALH